jgi:hypothetical protein
MADRVDASVDGAQPADLQPVIDRVCSKAKL